VASQVFDHTSVLRMIEWRWRLRPLTIRDATANNLAEVFDFSRRNLTPPAMAVPSGPYGDLCPITGIVPDEWMLLAEIAEQLGLEILQP